jgi:MFS family permease
MPAAKYSPLSPMPVIRPLAKPHAIMAVFALHAFMVGSLYSRIAEIQKALNLSEETFGLALMGLPAGVFFGSPLVGLIIERLGPRKALLALLPAFAAGPLIVALAVGPVTLALALALHGFLLSVCNIAMNVEADRIEAESGARIINRCHGCWGLGLLIIYALAAGAIAAGISPLQHYAALFVAIVLGALAIIAPMAQSKPRPHAGGKASRFALPGRGTFLIVGYAAAGIWIEGVARNWSVIYLRDAFGAVEWLAALSLAAIVATQTAGRFLADAWMDRHGAVRVARALTLVGLAGLALIAFAGSIPAALAGFALIGLGISTVYPQSVSAAARWGDRPSAENVAAFATVQTLIAFVASPLFGFVAGQLGLRAGFIMILPLPLLALYFARFLRPRG